jgi:hypothetical protein
LRDVEELLLEVSEDFTVAAEDGISDFQVKNSQAAAGPPSFSLQSPEITTVLNRYWDACQASATPRRLVFLSRGGAAVERHHSFPGNVPGLLYWRAAAIDADTGPLREALLVVLGATPLSNWLASNPSDTELRDRLLRNVQWELEANSAEELRTQITEQVGEICYSRNFPVTAAKTAVASLMDLLFETASKPKAADRRLSRLNLLQVIEENAGIALVAKASAAAAPSTQSSIENSLVTELADFTSPASRRDALENMLSQTRGQPLIWIHGSNGVGKSTLARLAATELGGNWLELDLRPVQTDKAGSLTAWKELSRTIALSDPFDGVIIDDFDDAASIALRSRLCGLARMFGSRGGRLIVTSHHEPSAALLSDCGAQTTSSFQAPYFSEADVTEIVMVAPRPEDPMVLPWSKFLQLTTNGGHPLLVAAKAASLRSQGWPSASLLDDVIKPGEALRITRDEARRTLLSDLSSLDASRSLEAGDLLRRISCMFDRVDEGLIMRLASIAPALRTAGDALAVLRGSWLEQLPGGDLRISPLLADMGKDVPTDERQHLLSSAAEYWVLSGSLDARTLPLCFWSAFWGEHAWVLTQICMSIATMPRESLRGAAALLSPMTVLQMDRPLLPSNTAVSVQLRLLQFEVADATEEGEVAVKVARRLAIELGLVEHEDVRALLTHTCLGKVLMAEFTKIPPEDRITYAVAYRAAEQEMLAIMDGEIPDPRTLLPTEWADTVDTADVLFAKAVARIDSPEDQLALVHALNAISRTERNGFLDAMSAIYEGDSVFVHSGWSKVQLGGGDMEAALEAYFQFERIAATWGRRELLLEVICAKAIILDEGLDRIDEAIAIIDDAIGTYGQDPILIRQKSKLYSHAERHSEAVETLLVIEDSVGARSSFDRALALREGAISAAKAGRLEDALRMIGGARSAISAVSDRKALSIGLMLEEALIKWRADDRQGAIKLVADALMEVSTIPVDESFQALRTHRMARAMVGLFMFEPPGTPPSPSPPLTFGNASSLESESKAPARETLHPISSNMRILAVVEAAWGLDVGVEGLSASLMTDGAVPMVEVLLSRYQYQSAIRSGDPALALTSGIKAFWVSLTAQCVPPNLRTTGQTALGDFATPDMAVLLSTSGAEEQLQSIVLDFVFCARIEQKLPLDARFWTRLREAVRQVFRGVNFEKFMDGLEFGNADALPANPNHAFALAITASENQVSAPDARFRRDVLLMQFLSRSLAIELLAPMFIISTVERWTFVAERQRFLLRNPARLIADIGNAIAALSESPKLSNLARLFEQIAPAVGQPFDRNWIEIFGQRSL